MSRWKIEILAYYGGGNNWDFLRTREDNHTIRKVGDQGKELKYNTYYPTSLAVPHKDEDISRMI